ELVKIATGNATDHVEWLARHVKAGDTVGVDGSVLGIAAAQFLQASLQRAGATLRTDFDVLAEVWQDRPGLPDAAVYERGAPHAHAAKALAALPASATLLIDPRRVTLGLRENVPAGVKVIEAINPSTLFKSRKSAAEAVHVREAMAQDGAAMCEFYAWL